MAGPAKDTKVAQERAALTATEMLKDLLVTAFLATAIFGPIIGLKTTSGSGTLVLDYRLGYAAAFIAITVAVRLLILLYGAGRSAAQGRSTAAAQAIAAPTRAAAPIDWTKFLAPLLLTLAIALPFIAMLAPQMERRIVDLGILVLTYVMLGWGLNVVVGLAGLLDLGYVAFYAVGAYAYGLLATRYFPQWLGEGILPWAFFVTLPIAGILAALWGMILGFPVLRLRGDYLAIVTLAFGEIIRIVLINWLSFTGGPNGIS
ncbi:MAG TPA: DUF3382 domain-containing protein, partial [Aestuariivirga sp.]|nr:DUF3382 domain-containing protein [Aestuariivirga sp.]